MRVVILGSGVVGVTSAYYLARAGHEVTVIDREAGPALETSFANAGQISPGYASPWAAPGVPLKAVKWMFEKHAPLAIRLDGTQFQLQWMWQMLQNCTRRAMRSTRAAWCASPNTAATACKRCAPTPASITKAAPAARCRCSARSSNSMAPRKISPC